MSTQIIAMDNLTQQMSAAIAVKLAIAGFDVSTRTSGKQRKDGCNYSLTATRGLSK